MALTVECHHHLFQETGQRGASTTRTGRVAVLPAPSEIIMKYLPRGTSLPLSEQRFHLNTAVSEEKGVLMRCFQ